MERYKAWQFATLARQLLPLATAIEPLTDGSPEISDLSFAREVRLFR